MVCFAVFRFDKML